jgi:hypothetical protein
VPERQPRWEELRRRLSEKRGTGRGAVGLGAEIHEGFLLLFLGRAATEERFLGFSGLVRHRPINMIINKHQ